MVTDWSASDILTFASGRRSARGDYVETTAASFDAAATAANALIATGATNIVAVAVGSDLVVFADSANDNGVADDAIILQGRGLNDIPASATSRSRRRCRPRRSRRPRSLRRRSVAPADLAASGLAARHTAHDHRRPLSERD